jgi:hypothetical protein
MDYVGLHNKPKDEVHLEHMRTGPKEEEEEDRHYHGTTQIHRMGS